jgi:isopenicillin N synthase-like dioxygenase
MESIHLVDIRDHTSDDAGRRAAFSRTLRHGLEEHGFLRVAGHAVDGALMARAFELYAAFFALDEADRVVCGGVSGGQRGHTPFGVEHARDHPVPDLKEFFHVGQELDPADPLWAVYPANVWPEALPELRPTTLALYRSLEECAEVLLEALADAFELPRGAFASMLERGNSILRIAHYPPIGAEVDARALRAAPHEDINLVTLLCEASESGLEILARSGKWVPVVAGPGEIIADAGDMLARITNGVVPATTHRVVAGPGAAERHRYSMPFFAHPRPECDLSVLPRFVATGEAPRFPPITAGGFLDERLREIGLVG